MPEHLLLALDFVSSIVVCEITVVEYVLMDDPLLAKVLVTDVLVQIQVQFFLQEHKEITNTLSSVSKLFIVNLKLKFVCRLMQ
jgi:hypothetical protein